MHKKLFVLKIPFYKYHGTGNDFIIIDNRTSFFPKNDINLIRAMCQRRFGIGADGLMLLENHANLDFKMVYFNADGKEGSMCGNGGRCMVHFAKKLGVINNKTAFVAIDGKHHASITDDIVSLKMNDVSKIIIKEQGFFLDTGSPHHITWVDDIENYPVAANGRKIRNEVYGTTGSNINFVTQLESDKFAVRTYERGVEAETLSCGTGVTAVAIAAHEFGKTNGTSINLKTQGGILNVTFEKENKHYKNIYLTGPATPVFKGEWAW